MVGGSDDGLSVWAVVLRPIVDSVLKARRESALGASPERPWRGRAATNLKAAASAAAARAKKMRRAHNNLKTLTSHTRVSN